MKSAEIAVSELAFVFKLLPLLQDVDTIDRLYRLLLAIVTSGQTIGYPRAMILAPDERDGVIRGRYGLERSGRRDASAVDRADGSENGFDEMARSVFRNFEQVDAGDLTVKVRSYSVPMIWHRSALVKAVRTTYPVLAERGLSEFATDTFFDYFGVTSYIAIPIEFDRHVMAVLAVDRSSRKTRGSTDEIDEISVLYSLVQQTAAAAQHLLEASNNRRKARILSRLRDSLHQAVTASEFEESLKAVLAMVCRAVDGSVCLLKDGSSRKTITVESTNRSGETHDDRAVVGAMEEILDFSAGTLEPVSGDGSHPRVRGDAKERLAFFVSYPLLVGRDGLGALAVYTDREDNRAKLEDFRPGDKKFIEMCAGIVASAIEYRRSRERVGRLEDFVQEMSSNLVRERERSRIGDRSIEYHMRLCGDLNRLRGILTSDDEPARLVELSEAVESMQHYSGTYWDEVLADKANYAMTDLFKLARRVVEAWRPRAEKKGVQVTVRIPGDGASLLLDRDNVTDALDKVLTTTLSCLGEGDKVLVECSLAEERALVCVADNGTGLPGDIISRLFMPFVDVADQDEGKRALSLAGDILQKHSAEILIKSSHSWRTILVLSFPMAAGRDRRKRPADRRRRGDRRVTNRASRR